MNATLRFVAVINVFLSVFFLAGCETTSSGIQQARVDAAQRIAAEPPGDYFIGHRYFKGSVFKFWGYVRKPGQPWNTAQLVVLNEKQKLAPDREQLRTRGEAVLGDARRDHAGGRQGTAPHARQTSPVGPQDVVRHPTRATWAECDCRG